MGPAIQCACGNRIAVSTTQAGSQVLCDCGQLHAVPALSELRRQSGLPKYELNAVDTIRQMVAAGEMPGGKNCVGCGCETQSSLTCEVECQSPWLKNNNYWSVLILSIIAPIQVFKNFDKLNKKATVMGQECVVRAPLRLCDRCAAKVGTSQKKLKNLLEQVPAYADLLHEYPNSGITAVRSQ